MLAILGLIVLGAVLFLSGMGLQREWNSRAVAVTPAPTPATVKFRIGEVPYMYFQGRKGWWLPTPPYCQSIENLSSSEKGRFFVMEGATIIVECYR